MTSAPNNSNTDDGDSFESQVLARLAALDDDYDKLSKEEDALLRIFEKLQQDETCLRKALDDMHHPPSSAKTKQDAALLRLEEALMQESDDDESNKAGAAAIVDCYDLIVNSEDEESKNNSSQNNGTDSKS